MHDDNLETILPSSHLVCRMVEDGIELCHIDLGYRPQ